MNRQIAIVELDADDQVDDGAAYALPGAATIYAPAGQAGEYAPLATNPYRGCGHGCAYCYVPNVLRMKRAEFDAGAIERPGYLQKLRNDARRYQAAGNRGQVMLSFTSDPYHPGDTSTTRTALEVLRDVCVRRTHLEFAVGAKDARIH